MVSASRQRGHSLTELLVAMAVAGLLLAGVAQAFFANTQTFGVVSEQNMIQENGRLALTLIGTQLSQTGFIRDVSAQNFYDAQMREEQFRTGGMADLPLLNRYVTGAVVAGLNNDGGSAIGSYSVRPDTDVLLLRYQKAPEGLDFRDCVGEHVNSSFAVDTATVGFFVDNNMVLRCIRANRSAGASREIIDGVEDMQVLYGVDADGAAPARADRYLKASEMTEDDWRRVVTVSVALLVRPGQMAMTPPRTGVSRTFRVNDETREVDGTVARTVYSQTFQIRNRIF